MGNQSEGPLPHTFGLPQQNVETPQQCNQPESPTNSPPPYEEGGFIPIALPLPLPNVNNTGLNRADHQHFISKVYRYLTFQIAVIVVLLYFFDVSGIRYSYRYNPSYWWLGFNLMVVTLVVFSYYEEKRRLWPKSSLATFTFVFAFFLGSNIAMFKRSWRDDELINSIFWAALISLGLIFALTKFSIQTKREFTLKASIQLMGIIDLLAIGVLCMFDDHGALPYLIGGIGAFMFSVYVIYYTQITLKEERENSVVSLYRADASNNSQYIIVCLDIYMHLVKLVVNSIFDFFNLTKEVKVEKSGKLIGLSETA